MKFHPDYELVTTPAPVEQEVKKTAGRPKKTESNHEGE
jgi:hypothetical protein